MHNLSYRFAFARCVALAVLVLCLAGCVYEMPPEQPVPGVYYASPSPWCCYAYPEYPPPYYGYYGGPTYAFGYFGGHEGHHHWH
jgi:hypothetical protein